MELQAFYVDSTQQSQLYKLIRDIIIQKGYSARITCWYLEVRNSECVRQEHHHPTQPAIKKINILKTVS